MVCRKGSTMKKGSKPKPKRIPKKSVPKRKKK